jgi:ATP-binding cassette subfamily F protein 3
MILACHHIYKSFIEDTVLKDVNFHIEANEKVALIGNNGAGKTTLFRILTKELPADSGEVYYAKDCSIGYLKQQALISSDKTVYEELLSVFDEVILLEQKMTQLEEAISTSCSEELIHQYDALRLIFENKKGYSYKSLIKGVLKGLGFSNEAYDQPLSQLSGGQKTRVALAKLLLEEPNILLLDEPTNHLDIEAIEWLESFLKTYNGAVFLISHDRYFLDKIVTKVIHLEFGQANVYFGNYSYYLCESAKVYEALRHQFEKQQNEIAKQQAVIAKLRQFNREKSIKRARSREKALAKMDKPEIPMIDNKPMNLILAPQMPSANDVLTVTDLGKTFKDGKMLFENISFQIKKGDKVAIVGPNGVGKTTLFRMLLGKNNPTCGEITLGSRVNIGYYDQEHATLDPTQTIFSEIQSAFPALTNGHIRNVLAAFLFTGEDVFKSIESLSGGEKGRVALAKIMLSQANFLILDEPTNHLDVLSKEVLENALSQYEGTILYISHDRYFINQTATKILEMQPDRMTVYLGDYDYYTEKRKVTIKEQTPSDTLPSSNQLDRQRQKELQTKIRKIQNNIVALEKEIDSHEQRIAEIDDLLCQEEIYSQFDKSQALLEEKSHLTQCMEELYVNWEILHEQLQEMQPLN